MKYFLLVGLIFSGLKSFSQIKLHTNIDKFSGDTTITTDNIPLQVYYYGKKDSSILYQAYAGLTQNGAKKNYRLTIVFTTHHVMSIGDGGIAYFKTSAGEILSAMKIGKYEIISTDDDVYYSLDIASIIDKLKTVEITNIRFTTGDGDKNIDLKDHTSSIANLLSALPN